MSWPTATEYSEAIQNLGSTMRDPELRAGMAATNTLGTPLVYSGGLGCVFKIVCANTGKVYAVKCFTREVSNLQERYRKISEHLAQHTLPFMVDFKYHDEEILVQGRRLPILKMQWVDGLGLEDFFLQHLDQPGMLRQLLTLWPKLAQRLRAAHITHADLQHGNVMMVPTAGGGLLLRLIDYDGMHIPALSHGQSGEYGHDAYQHPSRLKQRIYSADVDRFSHLVIYNTIQGVIAGGRQLWDRYHSPKDNLIFKPSDFANPGESQLFGELWSLGSSDLRAITARLLIATQSRLEQIPQIDELVQGDQIQPLTAVEERQAVKILNGALKLSVPKNLAEKVAEIRPGIQTAETVVEKLETTVEDEIFDILTESSPQEIPTYYNRPAPKDKTQKKVGQSLEELAGRKATSSSYRPYGLSLNTTNEQLSERQQANRNIGRSKSDQTVEEARQRLQEMFSMPEEKAARGKQFWNAIGSLLIVGIATAIGVATYLLVSPAETPADKSILASPEPAEAPPPTAANRPDLFTPLPVEDELEEELVNSAMQGDSTNSVSAVSTSPKLEQENLETARNTWQKQWNKAERKLLAEYAAKELNQAQVEMAKAEAFAKANELLSATQSYVDASKHLTEAEQIARRDLSNDVRAAISRGDRTSTEYFLVKLERLVPGVRQLPSLQAALQQLPLATFLAQADTISAEPFSSDGKLFVTCSAGREVILWDAASGEKRQTFATSGFPKLPRISPDGMYVGTLLRSGSATMWNVATGESKDFSHRPRFTSCSFSDDSLQFNLESSDGITYGWNVKTGEKQFTGRMNDDTEELRALNSAPRGLSDKHDLEVTNRRNLFRFEEICESNRQLLQYVFKGMYVTWDGNQKSKITFSTSSPDHSLLLTGLDRNWAVVWNADRGSTKFILDGHQRLIRSAVFSSDGRFILTGAEDNTAILWDSSTGESLLTFPNHEAPVTSVGFASNETLIFTISSDFTARLWERVTGDQRFMFRGHLADISLLVVSPDEKHAITRSVDNVAILWELP